MNWTTFLCILVTGTCIAHKIPVDELPYPNIDNLAALKERCDSKGGLGTYDKVAIAKTKLQTCITGMFNVKEIKAELEEKAKTGSMDEVFGKYCNKRPQLRTCVHEFLDAVKPCLEAEEKSALNTTLHIVEELGEFGCYRDGDRLAMFVAEGGVECLRDHADGVRKCAESTLKDQNKEISRVGAKPIPSYLFNEDRCDDLNRMRACVVDELEKCEESTPANIVDAVFKFIRKQACESTHRKRSIRPRLAEWLRKHDECTDVTLSKFNRHIPCKTFIKTGIFKRSVVDDWLLHNETRGTIMTVTKSRCEKYGTPDSYKNILTSYDDAMACIRKKKYNLTLGRDNYRGKIHDCMRPYFKDVQVCLPQEEQYTIQFYYELLDSVIDFLYEKQLEFQAKTFSTEIMSCFLNYKQNSENINEIKSCIINEDISDNLVTKEELCRKLNEKLDCLSQSMDRVCVRDIEIHMFVMELSAAIKKPCEKKV